MQKKPYGYMPTYRLYKLIINFLYHKHQEPTIDMIANFYHGIYTSPLIHKIKYLPYLQGNKLHKVDNGMWIRTFSNQ